MEETWLPVQLGGNARWAWNSQRDEVTTREEIPDVGNSDAFAAFFPTVPDDQLWAFERIALLADAASGLFIIRVFIDDDRTPTSQAFSDPERIVDGVWQGAPLEVLARPVPLLVPAGSRLGIVWINNGGTATLGTAHAQITTYVRA